jgi:hypothetical protein
MDKMHLFRFDVEMPVVADCLENAEEVVSNIVSVATDPLSYSPGLDITYPVSISVTIAGYPDNDDDAVEDRIRHQIEHVARVLGHRRPTVTFTAPVEQASERKAVATLKRELVREEALAEERYAQDRADRGIEMPIDVTDKPKRLKKKVS